MNFYCHHFVESIIVLQKEGRENEKEIMCAEKKREQRKLFERTRISFSGFAYQPLEKETKIDANNGKLKKTRIKSTRIKIQKKKKKNKR